MRCSMPRQGTTLLRLIQEKSESYKDKRRNERNIQMSYTRRPWYVLTKLVSVVMVPHATMMVGTEDTK
jgi:hypothetical protein